MFFYFDFICICGSFLFLFFNLFLIFGFIFGFGIWIFFKRFGCFFCLYCIGKYNRKFIFYFVIIEISFNVSYLKVMLIVVVLDK